MNRVVMDHLMRRMRHPDDRRDGRSEGSDYANERDYRGDYARGDSRRDYREDYRDSRSSRDYRDYRDSRDYEDSRKMVYYNDNERDYHDEPPLHLTKHDMRKWDSMIENFDGSRGCHYELSNVIHCAEKLGIKFKDFSEKELYMATNMMYADYGKTVKKHTKSSDEELEMFIELAKDFLDDPDGPEPSEKLALYFHCIVNSSQV